MKHKYSLKWIHVISIFLAILVTWISCPIYALNQVVSAETSSVEWHEKIAPSVYEKAEKKDDKYLVYVFREDISTETINEAVARKTGFDPSIYETDKFESCVVPELERQIASYEQIAQMQSVVTRLVLGEPVVSTIEQAKQTEMNNYITAKRGVVKELNTENNDLFVNEYINDMSDIVYRSRYTSTIIAYLTKEEIETCARSKDVETITPYEPSVETVECADIVEHIGVDSSAGTKSNQYNSGSGYQGAGVKIGVIEPEGGICDIDHPQLSGIIGTQLVLMDNVTETGFAVIAQESEHATYVTSLIVGQRIEVNGDVYEGVVPEATVYQIPAYTSSDVLNAIQILVDVGVSVINYSGGNDSSGVSYTAYDLEVDKMIETSDVTFVKSAGNNGQNSTPSVTSPGKAYNAITVGGVETKMELGILYSSPYSMYTSSSYAVDSFLTNKPDIVAPGRGFFFIEDYDATTGDVDVIRIGLNGTSFSAPLVTGVIAQLQQANASLKTNPTAAKAVLLAGADFDTVSATNNDLWEDCSAARVKSGVGFLNAKKAVSIAKAGNYQYSTFFMDAASRYIGRRSTSALIEIPANSKVRVVLTYNKPEVFTDIEDFAYGNNLDLELFYRNQYCYASSFTPFNNVEVIECVVDTAGTYALQTYVDSLMQTETRVIMNRSVAWYIEPVT